MVDWVLPVAKMAPKLLEFVQNENRMKLPPEIPEADEPDAKVKEAPGGETVSKETRDSEDETAIGKVLADVRATDRARFRTLQTRDGAAADRAANAGELDRNRSRSISILCARIRGDERAASGSAHRRDAFLSRSRCFRCARGAHSATLRWQEKDDEIRVWVAAARRARKHIRSRCCFANIAERLENPPKVQIFATDIDEQAIAEARDGLYPSMIEADVSPERLREFFQRTTAVTACGRKCARRFFSPCTMCLKDAPFSRCDLISCRNLLIYLTAEAQAQSIRCFSFLASRPGGLLFLGSSENHSTAQSLFSPVDAKHRVFVRRSTPRPIWKVPAFRCAQPGAVTDHSVSLANRPLPPLDARVADGMRPVRARSRCMPGHARREVLFGELHLRLLEQYGPPSIVVNESHEIVHLSESAGRYLAIRRGRADREHR